ncbi:DUF3617 domain-containing protein [Steroidobacter gossypii]|uniref:DUF3617 domain-containing protein n=1 Tax=Steroidobacter gossypii TaxID=2805490 RepID=UPI001C3FF271|nr:DUF3617 family protein [Steroidobacter gossypii]
MPRPLVSDTSGPARLYDVTVATSMPHLEENLRYAVSRTQRCLTREDLAAAFPVLQQPPLAGCKLHEQITDEATIAYVLLCENSSGTTGTATWQIGDRHIRGTLDVTLGGKNMTFSQRLTGRLIGTCPSQ